MDIQYLMRQAKKLEKAMAQAKEKLGELSVEAESGGGLVKVQMNGKCEVTRLAIDPKALEPFGSAERRAEAQPQHPLEPFGSAERRAEAQPQHPIDPNDKAMLEDLVTAAVNAAVEKARAAADAHMASATGGIKMPGIG
ncbi:MAG TPA: YbaB/EbfC family nucleoid-associated protein [Anaeromyxobacter sp.]